MYRHVFGEDICSMPVQHINRDKTGKVISHTGVHKPHKATENTRDEVWKVTAQWAAEETTPRLGEAQPELCYLVRWAHREEWMERSYGKEHADGIVAACQTHWMFSKSAKIRETFQMHGGGTTWGNREGRDERYWSSENLFCFSMLVWPHPSFDHCTRFYLLINPNC